MRYVCLLWLLGAFAIQCDAQSVKAVEWNQRGNTAFAQEKYGEAEQAYRRALDLATDHHQAARLWSNLAVALKKQRQWREAAGAYEHSLKLRADSHEADTADYAITLSNLAETRCQLQQTEIAVALLRRALRILESLPQPPQRDVAAVLNNFGVAKGRLGYYTAGARMLTQALRLKQSLYGPVHPEVRLTEANLAALHREAATVGGPSPYRVDVMEWTSNRR
ncbi:MAG: tetratricopeptide repeat protein [Bryobacterales bacterium]|nr:tetratricopeptide repeat protein [Bryobacterales bacterium]